jgi:two-component system LytT family response regulator
MIKCVIVDDEQLARQLLVEFLSEYSDIEIVAECSSGKEAIVKIDELGADLVLLDVQMPGVDGFDVLENIKTSPFVIFCTAYERYAVRAFDKNAIDYLLKPLDQRRFRQAINKATERISNNDSNFMNILADIKTSSHSDYSQNLFVQKSEKLVNIPVDSIVHIEASKDYTIITTDTDQYLSSSGISKLEEKLDPQNFMRIHRSTIININMMVDIERLSNNTLAASMENGKVFTISRSYSKAIKERML